MSLIGRIIGLRSPEERTIVKQQKQAMYDQYAAEAAIKKNRKQLIRDSKKISSQSALNLYKKKLNLVIIDLENQLKDLESISSDKLVRQYVEDINYELAKLKPIARRATKVPNSIQFKKSSSTFEQRQQFLDTKLPPRDLNYQRNNYLQIQVQKKQQEMKNKQTDIKSDEADVKLKAGSMSEEDKLDKQIAIAQKKKELLKLQKEIKDLEGDDPIEE